MTHFIGKSSTKVLVVSACLILGAWRISWLQLARGTRSELLRTRHELYREE